MQHNLSTEGNAHRGRVLDLSARRTSDASHTLIDADNSLHAAIEGLHADDRALLAVHSEAYLRSLGMPPHELALDRIRARTETVTLLGLQADQVGFSPLGPAWSTDLDLDATEDPPQLNDAGWLTADPFLLGLHSPGRGRWLVRSEGRIIGQVDFAQGQQASRATDAGLLAKTLMRARARGRVELRDVLELRHLARSGQGIPQTEITKAAGRLEASLAGDRDVRIELSEFADQPEQGPIAIHEGSIRRRAAALRRWARPRPVVALSGVDGAGKSSLTAALLSDFERMGVQPDVIWARPGMRMEWIEPILRSRSEQQTPTVAKVASGQHVDASSRRGVVGWIWTMLVTGTFLSHIWWRHLATSGVKIYDRHLDDAIITLDFVYAGVDLRVQRKLISWFLPRASITLYLSIDADTAVRRKPGDTFGQHAVESQLRHYADLMHNRPDVTVLDATRNPRDIANEAFAQIIERVR